MGAIGIQYGKSKVYIKDIKGTINTVVYTDSIIAST